jgi:diguanylate cyclase (GGDEF)-like protein
MSPGRVLRSACRHLATVGMRTRTRRSVGVLTAATCAACVLWAPLAPAQERVGSSRSDGGEVGFAELDAETRHAIEKGVAWLAAEQLDGSGRWPTTPTRYQMSITAMAGLALLAHGDTPDSGKHMREVRKAVEWVLTSQKRDKDRWPGLLFDGDDVRFDPDDRTMHGHGFALLFLAEAYGQTRDPQLRERMHAAIAAGVRLTERTITRDGGWFYQPGETRDEGSVTVTQIQALRSARNAGISVDAATIERAVNYIKASQKEDGGVQYTLKWGKTSAALTAAGVTVLHGAGEYHGPALEKGYAYLREKMTTNHNDAQFFYYEHFYMAQAMFQRGGPEWANYFPAIRRELLALRRGQPYWESPGAYGKSYATANALLILQLPLRYTPGDVPRVTTETGSAPTSVSHWAVLYEPDRLISAKSFDLGRTTESSLAVAMRLMGADAGFLATLEKGHDLVLLAAQGVDQDAVLEDPQLGRLVEQAIEEGAIALREGLTASPALRRAGGPVTVVVAPLRLGLRTPSAVARERRRFPGARVVKPLGIMLLVLPAGAPPSADRLASLETFADHTGEVLINARLYHGATHDPLTDLYRRQELEQHLAVELTIARHTNAPVSLVMVDIDELGKVNNQHGRARGDRVIARVAKLIKAQVRDDDACIRYGGEEFAVVLPNTDQDGAQATAEKVRRAVADYPGFGGLKVTASCGVAVFPYHAEAPAELLRKADQTLFLAKQEGGNRALVWHKRIPKHALRSDKLLGIITGNQSKDYRNVMMLLDTIVVVSSILERKQVLGTLLDMMIQLASSERGALFLERDGELMLEVAQDAAGNPIEGVDAVPTVIDRVRHMHVPVAYLGDPNEEDEDVVEAARAQGLEQVIALPLKVRTVPIGLMYFDSRTGARDFEESDLIFMQALARELGNAIESSRLYQENVEQKKALEELTSKLAQKVQAQATELADLERNLSQLQLRFNYDKIIGKSEAMQKVFRLLDRITDTDVPVLIQGETGTGKELVARALHHNGPRKDGPFVSVNCSALNESLLESELFGHVKGAFTGAEVDKPGLFEQAHKGTIFLDEVQDMSPGMQRELLRVLQEGEVRRVGGKDIIHVDVRVISATNRDLRELVRTGGFRQDLFYRLNVVTIELPPLRDRKEDIPLIVQRLLEEVRTPDGRLVKLEKEALRAILRYDWPGNVRQLQNFIEKTVLLIEGDTIKVDHVRLDGGERDVAGVSRLFELDYEQAKQAFAREYLKSVLARNGGNVTRASSEAQIVRSSFHKMMRKHGLAAKDFGGAREVTERSTPSGQGEIGDDGED